MLDTIEQKNRPALKGFGYLFRRGRLWWIRYSVGGKDYRESSKSENETDALRLLKLRWKEVGRGRFIGPAEDRVTVGELLDLVDLDYKINARRSIGDLKGRIRHLRAAFGDLKAIDVSETRLEKYKLTRLGETTERGNREIKPATVNRELAVLRKAFRMGVDRRLLSFAPKFTMLDESAPRQGFVEPPDFEKIVAGLPDYLKDFARFAYHSGWRSGEIKSLEWANVNREAKTIFLGTSKNGEPRILPIAGGLSEIIERRWQARTFVKKDKSTLLAKYVFHHNGHKIVDHRKVWATACRAANCPGLLMHDLRRSAIRNFDRNGVSQFVGMMISGHKTTSVYKRYRIVPENDIREALEKVQQAIAGKRDSLEKVTVITDTKEATGK